MPLLLWLIFKCFRCYKDMNEHWIQFLVVNGIKNEKLVYIDRFFDMIIPEEPVPELTWGAVTTQKRLWLNPHEEEQRKRKQKSPCVYFPHGLVMSPKKRQNDSETGKKNKKEKRGELAVINSDMRDHAVQKCMTDAWQRKESYSNGMYAHPRDTLNLHYFNSHLYSYCEQNPFAF